MYTFTYTVPDYHGYFSFDKHFFKRVTNFFPKKLYELRERPVKIIQLINTQNSPEKALREDMYM